MSRNAAITIEPSKLRPGTHIGFLWAGGWLYRVSFTTEADDARAELETYRIAYLETPDEPDPDPHHEPSAPAGRRRPGRPRRRYDGQDLAPGPDPEQPPA